MLSFGYCDSKKSLAIIGLHLASRKFLGRTWELFYCAVILGIVAGILVQPSSDILSKF